MAEEKKAHRWSWEYPPEEDALLQAKESWARYKAARAASLPPPPDGPLVRFARRLERLLGLHA